MVSSPCNGKIPPLQAPLPTPFCPWFIRNLRWYPVYLATSSMLWKFSMSTCGASGICLLGSSVTLTQNLILPDPQAGLSCRPEQDRLHGQQCQLCTPLLSNADSQRRLLYKAQGPPVPGACPGFASLLPCSVPHSGVRKYTSVRHISHPFQRAGAPDATLEYPGPPCLSCGVSKAYSPWLWGKRHFSLPCYRASVVEFACAWLYQPV